MGKKATVKQLKEIAKFDTIDFPLFCVVCNCARTKGYQLAEKFRVFCKINGIEIVDTREYDVEAVFKFRKIDFNKYKPEELK